MSSLSAIKSQNKHRKKKNSEPTNRLIISQHQLRKQLTSGRLQNQLSRMIDNPNPIPPEKQNFSIAHSHTNSQYSIHSSVSKSNSLKKNSAINNYQKQQKTKILQNFLMQMNSVELEQVSGGEAADGTHHSFSMNDLHMILSKKQNRKIQEIAEEDEQFDQENKTPMNNQNHDNVLVSQGVIRQAMKRIEDDSNIVGQLVGQEREEEAIIINQLISNKLQPLPPKLTIHQLSSVISQDMPSILLKKNIQQLQDQRPPIDLIKELVGESQLMTKEPPGFNKTNFTFANNTADQIMEYDGSQIKNVEDKINNQVRKVEEVEDLEIIMFNQYYQNQNNNDQKEKDSGMKTMQDFEQMINNQYYGEDEQGDDLEDLIFQQYYGKKEVQKEEEVDDAKRLEDLMNKQFFDSDPQVDQAAQTCEELINKQYNEEGNEDCEKQERDLEAILFQQYYGDKKTDDNKIGPYQIVEINKIQDFEDRISKQYYEEEKQKQEEDDLEAVLCQQYYGGQKEEQKQENRVESVEELKQLEELMQKQYFEESNEAPEKEIMDFDSNLEYSQSPQKTEYQLSGQFLQSYVFEELRVREIDDFEWCRNEDENGNDEESELFFLD